MTSQPPFRPGDRVEFLSGDGTWKPAVVDSFPAVNGYPKNVRLGVGNGVFLVRKVVKVRLHGSGESDLRSDGGAGGSGLGAA